MKRLIYSFIISGISFPVFAEDKIAQRIGSGNIYFDILLIALALFILLLLWVSIMLLKTFKKLSAEFLNPTPLIKKPERLLEYDEWMAIQKSKPGIWTKLLSLRPLSEEKDMTLDHEFDGIVELDNPVPAWFNWLFYGTITIGLCYLLYFHVFDWGKLQDEEYQVEVQQAKAAKDAYLANTANLIDENTIKESSEASVIAAGAVVFSTNCVACHGDKAQGIVGPNLTDEYWLHGGKVNDVFKTIKYGVPDKGMISWEKSLSPKQISDVTNFIKSLKGSKPANPKAPQGEKEG